MTKWLNPDATTADMGEAMQAYYDEKRKVWVFPGEDPDEKAKPIGPPPMTPTALATAPETQQTPTTPTTSSDPLAAMMAPPQRNPSSLRRATPSGRTPGMRMPTGPGAPPPVTSPPPQFTVFKPKDEKK